MPVWNAHFYAQNEGRAYPVDDGASGVADDGGRLPPDILTDLALRWPASLGGYAFVSAVSVTAALVTLTVQAAAAPDAVTTLNPLAVLTVRKPVQVGRVYALQPQADGVGGWVVFGGGANDLAYQGRFSTPSQSRLTPRCGRAYRPLPVASLQAQNAAAVLTGVVTLKASEPLRLTKEERFLAGAFRDCIVFSLVDDTAADGFPVPAAATAVSGFKQPSLFQQFAGPCAGRPESDTCDCPTPVQFINAVAPDCDGVITLAFKGCADLAAVAGAEILVTCDMGLAAACLPPHIPGSDGRLPSEGYPAVVPPAVTPVPLPPPIPPIIPPPPPPPAALPYVGCVLSDRIDFVPVQGEWAFSPVTAVTPVCAVSESASASLSLSLSLSHSLSASVSVAPATPRVTRGSFETTSAAYRSVALFPTGDPSTSARKVTTEAMLLPGLAGDRHNAQLVLNYRPVAGSAVDFVYYAAQLDYDTQTFSLVRWTTTTFQTVAPATVVAPGIQLETWYRLSATIDRVGTAGEELVTIRVESVSTPGALDVTLSALVTTNYQPDTGVFGVGANRALARFGYILVEKL